MILGRVLIKTAEPHLFVNYFVVAPRLGLALMTCLSNRTPGRTRSFGKSRV